MKSDCKLKTFSALVVATARDFFLFQESMKRESKHYQQVSDEARTEEKVKGSNNGRLFSVEELFKLTFSLGFELSERKTFS